MRAGDSHRPGALVCASVVVLSACFPEPATTRDTSGVDTMAPAPAPVIVQRPDSLAVELIVAPQVRAGDAVPMTMRVRNRSGQPHHLYLRGRSPTLDVVITRATGDTVWQRLKDEIIPAILAVRTLGPGEELEVEARWDQRTQGGAAVAAGEYVVRAELLTDGEPLATAPVALRIVER